MLQVGGTGKAPRHKHAWRSEGVLSASSPGLFTSEERAPVPTVGWVLLRSDVGAMEKSLLIQPGIEPRLFGRPSRRPSLYRLSY